MKPYKENIPVIVEITKMAIEEIFDFEGTPMEDELNTIYEFYTKTLENHAHYGIEPNFLFFRNSTSVNAAATKCGDHYLICINSGTIHNLIMRFRNNPDLLNDSDNEDFIEFAKLLDSEITELLYQNALHLTFYHELAHLIQNSDLLLESLYEVPVSEESFNIRRHVLEFDSDQFSSLCLGSHFTQYAERTFGNSITEAQFEKLLVLSCSSSLFYFLSFGASSKQIYYEENTHPHPLIRIICIVLHTTKYSLDYYKSRGINFTVTSSEIVRETLNFVNNILVAKYGDDSISTFQQQIKTESKKISEYVAKIHQLSENDRTLASYKWNIIASKNTL